MSFKNEQKRRRRRFEKTEEIEFRKVFGRKRKKKKKTKEMERREPKMGQEEEQMCLRLSIPNTISAILK